MTSGESDATSFKLSRIYAEGWNAAGKLSAEQSDALNPEAIEELNPYDANPEQAQWVKGFSSALGK